MSVRGPAPKPCESCPYRKDTPSGVWSASEYDKLTEYDKSFPEQPAKVFQCHQNDRDDERARVCAGWIATHGGGDLLAVRLAAIHGGLSTEDVRAVFDYKTTVPVWSCGEEAAEYGKDQIESPSPEAVRMVNKIANTRKDLTEE